MKNYLLVFCLSIAVTAGATERFVGGDISLLPSYEECNTPYYMANGQKINDLVKYVHDSCGWTACRVRLFVNPVVTNPHDGKRQGEVQDLVYIAPLCKRIQDAGMALLLDFHYSDTWADPVYQTIPSGWSSLDDEALKDTLYKYTAHCLDSLVSIGVRPEFVQLGNEISYGMLKRSNSDGVSPWKSYAEDSAGWKRLGGFLDAGARAVREVLPESKIMIQVERVAKPNDCSNYYAVLNQMGVDYDVIGLSYYPFWHGYLEQELTQTLNALTSICPDKMIQIAETAYYNAYWPTEGIKYDTRSLWAVSPAGQDAFLYDLITTLKAFPNVNGLYYWFPEENGNGGASWNANTIVIDSWINRGLFSPSTHKEYAGLRRLGKYAEVETSEEYVGATEADGIIYTLMGVAVGENISALPQGAYIRNDKKSLITNLK